MNNDDDDDDNGGNDNEESTSSLKGSEPFLVGISPTYWTHVPMLIDDIINHMQLNGYGVNCLVVSVPNQSSSSSSSVEATTTKLVEIPISKCQLVGTIVHKQIRYHDQNSTTFVVDDGTGLIDCLQWSNHTNPNDMYYLPNLLDVNAIATTGNTNMQYSSRNTTNDINQQIGLDEEGFNDGADGDNGQFQLGDVVCIYGKIKCIARTPQNEVAREIIVTMMEKIDERTATNSLNTEARHWLKCLQQYYQHSKEIPPIWERTSVSYLHQLGPTIQYQVSQKQNMPSADDTFGKWRVFGLSCKCRLDYKHRLLYCHCQAKIVKTDPKFIFRDAILNILLEWQSNNVKKLVFPYSKIRNHPTLIEIANNRKNQLQLSSTANNNSNNPTYGSQLFQSTFRALRDDGILYLQDPNTDQYLLITRDKVLEPYLRNSNHLHTNSSKNNKYQDDDQYQQRNNMKKKKQKLHHGASFLSYVHEERLKYIQRCIEGG